MTCEKAYCEPQNLEQKKLFEEYENFMRFKLNFALFLSFIILGAYFSFLALVGFFPDFLGISIGESAITLGIVFGICAILLGVLGTYVYSFIANNFLDKRQEELLAKMKEAKLIV